MSDALAGPDGHLRCPWAESAPDYRDYHDLEWGRPVTTSRGLYERLTLEAFQSGLAWIIILRKRDRFRAAFAEFDPAVVAAFDSGDVDRLMGDVGIVRNRAKIDAAIGNAKVVAALGESFAEVVLGFRPVERPRPRTLAEVPALTVESTSLAKRLQGMGIRFVGPTTAYALMQAVGLVDDHLADCFVPTTDTAAEDRRGRGPRTPEGIHPTRAAAPSYGIIGAASAE